MKEQLSHSEIDRLIDEQERELDLLIQEAASNREAAGIQRLKVEYRSPAPEKWYRRLWRKLLGLG